MVYPKVFKAAAILAILVLIVVILVYAKPFLVPLAFGGLLAMVLLPVSNWLQSKGVHRVLAIILSILALMAFFALVIYFISWQISDIASNATKIEQQLTTKYHQAQQFISRQLGISPQKQQEMLQKQQSSSSGGMGSMITGFLAGLGSFLTNTILVLVYIFLFLYFRGRIKGFIVRLVPREQEGTALHAVHGVQQVAQKYLGGLAMMIALLWVMYGIGFTLVGVKNAFFFAIICGLLEIVPFVGNLTGTALTLTMSLVQGGGMNLVIGILVTYALVQFIQTYLIEPLVVGSEVSINPLFTILALVAGELLWGIPGMVLAIPLMGMAKIVCDHVEPLKPYSYLIGEEKKKDSGFKKKMKALGKKITGQSKK
ncbi:MAG TPA: AI-2E family transporter [Chitinophagaceae bacterium]